MELLERFMEEVPALDSAQWRALIERELKGKPWEDLLWEVEPGLTGQPFYHEPGREYGGPLRFREDADWMIMETIPVDGQPEKANRTALEALRMGAQSLCFEEVRSGDVGMLLDQVLLDVVPVIWRGAEGETAAPFRDALAGWLSKAPRGLSPADYRGGWLGPAGAEHSEGPFPNWRTGIPALPALLEPSAQLARALREALALIRLGVDPGKVIVPVEIGDQFLSEIARLRALRILWAHLMRSLGVPETRQPTVIARVRPDTSLPWEDHYISATIRGLSAVIGGADHLSILTPEHPAEDRMRRLCRNVQHLMKEESHLHRVLDPMAGSYAMEALTLALAERAWEGLEA